MSFVLSMLAIFCLGYYCFAASYAGTASSFLFFWIVAAGCLAVCALLCILNARFHWVSMLPKWLRAIALIVLVIGIATFCVLEGLIIKHMNTPAKADADYVIVLGAQVRGKTITKSLKSRLDAAYDYVSDNPDCIIIVSGGQGPGEDITEAQAMKDYLVGSGVEEDKIRMEEKSTSTKENLTYSLKIIEEQQKKKTQTSKNEEDGGIKTVIVTNDFHVYRAKLLAKKLGYESPQAIGSPTDYHLILNYMVRESLAIVKELVEGNI